MTPQEFTAARKRLGLTQAKLADRLGVNPRTVRRWEAGDSRIPKAVALALEAA